MVGGGGGKGHLLARTIYVYYLRYGHAAAAAAAVDAARDDRDGWHRIGAA